VIELYWKQFGTGISPPIEYTRGYPFEECVMLARKALRTGRAIPWYTMFTPLPPGALS
jgi:hypothetical protein